MDDRAAIADLIARQDAAWAAGDADAYSADIAADVVFTNIFGLQAIGHAAFLAGHANIFATIYKGARLSQTIVDLRFLGADVAMVHTDAVVSGAARVPPAFARPDETCSPACSRC